MKKLALLLSLAASLPLLAATLRVEPPSPDSETRFKLIFVAAPCGYPETHVTGVPRQMSAYGLPFVAFDLTPGLARLPPDQTSVDVAITTSGTGIWPMVTVTNNDTQQVTIIAPQ